MKKTFFLWNFLAFFLTSLNCQGQSFITVDGSQVFSNFKFINSAGENEKNFSAISTGGYSIGYRNNKPSGLFLRFNVGIRKAGSMMIYNNNDISWNLQYLDLRLGGGFELNKWRVKPYVSIAPYYSFLIKGIQTMDGLTYDLKVNNAFKSSDFGLLVIPGVRALVSDYISLYSEFSYLYGIQNLETDAKQKLYNKGFMITLGLAATLSKTKPQWLQGKR